MLRGGSWNNNPQNCRAAYRNRNAPANRNNNYGFRVCFRLHAHPSSGAPARLAGPPRTTGFRPGRRGGVAVLTPFPCRRGSFPGGRKVEAGAGW